MWDLPTRVLHWLLAGSFAGAFGVAVLLPRTHPAFPLHMLLGVTAALVVLLRTFWGFAGTRYARFRSFPLGARALLRHVTAFAAGGDDAHVGHDPFASWAALAMLAAVVGVAVTGAMSVAVPSLRRVHHLFAYGAGALVVVHVAGVVLSALRRRENLVLGMLDGKKMVTARQGLTSTRPMVALLFVALVAGAVLELAGAYDARARTVRLPYLGQVRLRPWGKRRARSGGPLGRAPHRGDHLADAAAHGREAEVVVDELEEIVAIPGLEHHGGAEPQGPRVSHHAQVCVRGEQDAHEVILHAQRLADHLDAVHARHGVVDDRDVEAVLGEQAQGVGARGREDQVELLAEDAAEGVEVVRVVVDGEEVGPGLHGLVHERTSSIGRIESFGLGVSVGARAGSSTKKRAPPR